MVGVDSPMDITDEIEIVKKQKIPTQQEVSQPALEYEEATITEKKRMGERIRTKSKRPAAVFELTDRPIPRITRSQAMHDRLVKNSSTPNAINTITSYFPKTKSSRSRSRQRPVSVVAGASAQTGSGSLFNKNVWRWERYY